MWVSKVVRFSRCFVTKVIAEQKTLKTQKQKKKLSNDLKKDLLWWKMFLDKFYGVELIIPASALWTGKQDLYPRRGFDLLGPVVGTLALVL